MSTSSYLLVLMSQLLVDTSLSEGPARQKSRDTTQFAPVCRRKFTKNSAIQLSNLKLARKQYSIALCSKRTGKPIEVKQSAQLRTITGRVVYLTEFTPLIMTFTKLKDYLVRDQAFIKKAIMLLLLPVLVSSYSSILLLSL